MARTNKKGELFSHLTQIGIFRDTGGGGSNTLNGAHAAGGTSVVVNAATGFAIGDWARVGVGEQSEIIKLGNLVTTTITPREPLAFDHASGDAVVEQTLTDLGHITDEGVSFQLTGGDEAVMSAVRRQVVGYLQGHVEGVFEFQLEGFNLENLATALGILESRISGSGTSSSPSRLVLDAAKFREENDLAFQATGVRKDGSIVYAQFWGVELDTAALSSALARGRLATIPVRGRVTSGMAVGIYTA